MPLVRGDKLGPYEILALLGKGGMGEVYRASDPRVGREVAIKICTSQFTERFEREARAIAALNHPNICQLYDVGPNYLVMELIEGEILGDIVRKGAIPFEDALRLAHQIAAALEAAHQKSIVHRDLKPGNIKIRPDGLLKVLDFGLAKIDQAPLASHRLEPDHDATLTLAGTEQGVILGTAPYMSPEQARGKPTDKRTDIWAFGAVLYEMLTGKRPFRGQTMTDILSAVVSQEPDWGRVPIQARRLVKVCLQKDPERRLHDIADMKLLLDEEPVESQRPSQSRTAWIAATAALILALGITWWAPWRTPPPAAESIRTQVYLPDGVDAAGRNFVISPDGRTLAFSAVGTGDVARVWVRSLDSLDVRPLRGTETTPTAPPFFWSPDSRFVVYSSAGGKVMKVGLAGSPPQALCDTIGPNAPGGSWNTEGIIIFGSGRGPLSRVSESGGTCSPLTVLDASRKETRHAFPTFLADARRFLYLRSSSIPENSGVYIGSLDAKPEAQDSKRLIATTFAPIYVPSSERGRGYLLIFHEGAVRGEGTVSAQIFDEGRMELAGEPVELVQQVGALIASGFFSASQNGVLVYRSGRTANQGQLRWWDRDGSYAGDPPQPASIIAMALAPDGLRGALVRQESTSKNGDIWMWDPVLGNSNRVTFDPGRAESPVFSPDGKQIVFASNRDGRWNLYRKPFNESMQDEVLLKSAEDKTPTSISPDGRFLLYTQASSQTKKDIWSASNPLGTDRRTEPFQQREYNESEAQFSPGESGPRWVAYSSDESGRPEVYVREFPFNAAASPVPVSKAGGSNPRWRKDGKELFFAAPDGSVMSVEITPGPAFQASAPKLLVRVPSGIRPNWVVTPDGKRFLVLLEIQQAAPFTVWQNWQAGLRR